MENKRGIVYLAFGIEFDKLNAATAKYSRQFTDLPMCVLSNLEKRSPVWKSVSDVTFEFIPIPSEENRRIKVSLVEYTPFEETLFMDSDAVLQRLGVEVLFEYLRDFDLACQYFGLLYYRGRWIIETSKRRRSGERKFYRRTYDKLAKLLGEIYPIELFGEAALLFRKTDSSGRFFALWKKYWEMMGCGRDMPAFSFAMKHTDACVKAFQESEIKFCTNEKDNRFFIQHKGFHGFEKLFNLPEYVDWNPKL